VVIDRIKDRLTVRELAEQAGAVFKKDAAACPLHGGDNPTAFHLRENDRKWHCFTNCPEGRNDGDVIDFYQVWKGVDQATAIQELAAMANLPMDDEPTATRRPSAAPRPRPEAARSTSTASRPPARKWQARARSFVTWSQQQLPDSIGMRYLEHRGISAETAEVWGLGWNPKFWKTKAETWGMDGDPVWLHPGIIIPHEDIDGEIWGIKIRVFKDGGAVKEKGGKYRGPRGGRGRGMLYGEPQLRRAPILMLTEGEFDMMLGWQEARDLCDFGTLAGARKRMHAAAMATIIQYPVTLAVLDDDDAADIGRDYLRKIPRVETVSPPDHDLTDFWQAGGDLRGWIAGQVADQMRRLLDWLNAEWRQELFVAWLEWYTRAEDARDGGGS
jgi:hypothetical protein